MTVQLETRQRLSRSLLWKLQQEAYKQFSVKAWTQKGVPFYLTSNPYTAKLYALITYNYFKDCFRSDSPTPIDPSHPVYILDLGAGSGRFSYLYLKHLLSLLERSPSIKVKPCLVMTDIVPSNIDFWQRHTYLQEYFKEGVLDAAYFHHSQSEPIQLIQSQKVLNHETVVNPLVLVGNYFFDTIPQDLFRIQNGQLEEGLVSLEVKQATKKEMVKGDDPSLINRLDYAYSYEPIDDVAEYYSDRPVYTKLLQSYCDCFDNTHFLFPTGSFEVIHYFEELSKGRFLLLAGDQGVCTEDQVCNWGEPKMAQHGSFSFPVSYHMLQEYFQMKDGVGFTTQLSDPAFVNLIAMEGGGELEYSETAIAFREVFDAFEPKDYWRLVTAAEENWKLPSLDFLLYTIKLGNYDPVNFYFFFNSIRVQLSNASMEQKNQLIFTIDKVWENFFPVDAAEGDFVMNLGVLLFDLKEYRHAFQYFERSLKLCGEKAITYLNMASCSQQLGDAENFQKCMQKAKKLQNLVLPETDFPPFLL